MPQMFSWACITVEEVEDMGLKDVTPKTESAILSNINDAIRAEATKPQTTDIDPDTGEVTNGTDSPLSVAAYLDDIANVPTVEGVDHKFAEASGYYKDDAATMAQLTLARSEEHTSELQSLRHLVCRL